MIETQDRTQGTWKHSVSLCHPSTLKKAGGNDFWIQNILCFRKCVKWIWIECMWYQRISTTDILETCDTKRLMGQRTYVTLNVTLTALNVQSTDSKIHDICREFWTRETYKGILCFGSQCIQWHCKTIGNVFARLWIKSSQDSTWLLFHYLSFSIFFGNSKTFFETKHHRTLKVVQTHIFCRITRQIGWKVCRGPRGPLPQDCIYVCIWTLIYRHCTTVQGL